MSLTQPSFSDAQKPVTPGLRSDTKAERLAPRDSGGSPLGEGAVPFSSGRGQLPLCKAKENFQVDVKLPRGPAWHLPPQSTGRGDTPRSGEPPETLLRRCGRENFDSWVFPAPSCAEFRAPAGEEGASRCFWPRWGCGRFGARAWPLRGRSRRVGTRR